MSPESRFVNNNHSLPKERRGMVRDWGEMGSYLPENMDPSDRGLLRAYFRAQRLLSEGRRRKASRLFGFLDKIAGYGKFEESNPDLLKLVDLAVKGETRW